VLAWAALALDGLDDRQRRWVGVAVVAAQLPWLLEMGRVWPTPLPEDQLPHMPPIRYVEMAIAAASVLAAAVAALRRAPAPPPARV